LTPIYITHTSAITPQHQEPNNLLQPLVSDKDARFTVIEPDYSTVIPPMQMRRMSRILKMGVYCGMDCIAQAGIAQPDGIITGTGKGSMIDTEKFVKELKQYNEEAMNPTPFILSTYNAINGAIALQTKSTGYNQTFVHRGSSFEVSLYDAQLKMNNSEDKQQYLIGCFDEITDEYFLVKSKINYWKKDRQASINLLDQSSSSGSIAGEGAAFFMVTNKPENALLAIHAIDIFSKPAPGEVIDNINASLDKLGWKTQDVDLVVLGVNCDKDDQHFYDLVLENLELDIPVLAFKHLCGEYETSGGFAIWLTSKLFNENPLPDEVWYTANRPKNMPKKILYYNHYRGQNHNVMLLSN